MIILTREEIKLLDKHMSGRTMQAGVVVRRVDGTMEFRYPNGKRWYRPKTRYEIYESGASRDKSTI